MLFERIESEGIAHYSYLIGQSGEALVIDPRRDCHVYAERAGAREMRIRYVLETHRNEDYVTGSLELAALTGAEIYHADSQLEYGYGRPVTDGQEWQIGSLTIRAISSPGHTEGMMSYLLCDDDRAPWVAFTGDALFAGDVGRVDFLGTQRLREMADKLYDTLFHALLPLGDGIIVCPAHGSGSVCAPSISSRVWTTIGIERSRNPRLQLTERSRFVDTVAKDLEKAPYFRQMEHLNLEGPPLLGMLPAPVPMTPAEFISMAGTAVVVDTRMPESFSASHIPGALSIWLEGLPTFAGWFLPYNKPLLIVTDEGEEEKAARYLVRLGYDLIAGKLAGGMLNWHRAGEKSTSNGTITVQELCTVLDGGADAWLLDVRSAEELEKTGQIPGAHHIHITNLLHHLEEIPKGRSIYIFCASGLRSAIAASLLQREGWKDTIVVLGGFTGWNSISCPIDR
jgi:hydroxyacylglutathione hydrolase